MNIGIDINEANVKNRVGTGQYTYQLLQYFASQTSHFTLYHRDSLQSDLPAASSHWRYVQVRPKQAWLRFGLPLHLLTHPKPQVWWSPAHYLPWVSGVKKVVTIHDLAYEYFPDLFLSNDLYKLKRWTRQAVRQADRIIAVSQATKQDLLELYQVPPEKITVIHNGYDAEVFNISHPADPHLLRAYRLKPNAYLLFLGTIQPRKNAIRLIQAYHLLKEKGYSGKLVIAGAIGWLAEETLRLIRSSPHARDIVLTGYVSDSTRKTLYTSAEVFVLPSLYEGFGVPVLEAMACGAPVACANNSSLPEVVGKAGVLFQATDPADILRAIETLRHDRDTWKKRGLAWVKHFSWEKCAQLTMDVLTDPSLTA